MFKTLVVALDLEADGDRALPVVQALAQRAAVRVDLITVSAPGMPSAVDAYELERRARRYGWDCDSWTIVHDVDAAAGIVEHAARRPEPLLVMATSAKRPMSSSMFGSVTREVLRRSQVPVLLIGPSVTERHAPASSALIVGLDRDTRAVSTVPVIVAWQATFGGQPPSLVEVVGPFEDDRTARRRLDEVAGDLAARHVAAAKHIVIAEDPVAGLEDVTLELDGPVYVAVSARYTDGRLHWHSTTQRLVAHARCPVLVVPARALPAPTLPHPAPEGAENHRAFHDRTSRAVVDEPATASHVG